MMNYLSLIIVLILLLIVRNAAYCQFYKLDGTMEMYYRGGSTSTTNDKKLSSFSEFTKLLSLQYPIYLWDPNLITISPSVRFYDADLRSESYLVGNQKEKKFVGDYKNFDYNISSMLFPGKGFPLSAHINRRRKTTNNDLFSDGDIITESKGFMWSFHLNRPILKHLPFFSVRYNLRETLSEQSSDATSFAETIDYNFNKTFLNMINLNYNYSTFDSDFYKYKYHRFSHKSLKKINKELELDIRGRYDFKDEIRKDEIKEFNTYYVSSYLRYRPDSSLFSYLNHILRINDNDNTYRQMNQINLNNQYRKYLLGSSKEKENVLFDGSLNYGLNYSIYGKEKKSYLTSHNINSRARTVYERLVYGVFLKPEYQLGLGYKTDSDENNLFRHSHRLLMGVDNRGYKYFYIDSDIFYEWGFSYPNVGDDILTKSYGYYHSIISRYIRNLYIEMPLKYKKERSSDNSSKDDFSTGLELRYRILRFLSTILGAGYSYSQFSRPGTDSFSESFRAKQELQYNYSGLNSNLRLVEEKKLRDNNIRENIISLKFITRYNLNTFSFLMEYNIISNNDIDSSLLTIRIIRKI